VITTNEDGVCLACQLARMQETGAVATIAIESGHASCEAEEPGQCKCGCPFSRYQACRECRRKGEPLDSHGQCIDRKACARTILDTFAAARQARQERAASAPVKSAPAGKRACACGCGETTGGGLFRPGHDARHVSNLVAETVAGRLTVADGVNRLKFSDKLVAKYKTSCERKGVPVA